MSAHIDIVFDGPPSDGGRFVEVEDANGRSIQLGEWIELDGLGPDRWVLRIPDPRPDTADATESDESSPEEGERVDPFPRRRNDRLATEIVTDSEFTDDTGRPVVTTFRAEITREAEFLTHEEASAFNEAIVAGMDAAVPLYGSRR